MPTLEFKGKQQVYAHHLTVPYRPLEPDFEKSHGHNPGQPDDNLIIHGDNLHALKALLPRYAGKVDCVYIDPPYNTGNEGWRYNDNVNSPLMRAWLAENGPVDGEDLERHDKWLCMMWPRLHLLRELLADDGVLFISIDHNEDHHLRAMMSEIFGEDAYRNTFAVARVKKSIRERRKIRGLNFGYNLVQFYGKSNESLILPPTKHQPKKARWHAFDAPGVRPNMEYDLFGHRPPQGRHWMFTEGRARELIEAGALRASPRTGKPQYRLDPSDETMLDTDWTDLQEYDNKFNLPNAEKNVELIKRIISMIDRPDAVILDSFAGSGTTAHAVLAANDADGGNRCFILAECEDYADTITAERVRRVINGIPDARDATLRDGFNGSFTFCTLGQPIELEAMLSGEALPGYSALAAYVLHTASGLSVGADALEQTSEDGLFYETDDINYYLLYQPDIEWLRGNEGVLNEARARRIEAECREQKRKAIVFAPAKYMSQRNLSAMRITFCQLPYELHNGG